MFYRLRIQVLPRYDRCQALALALVITAFASFAEEPEYPLWYTVSADTQQSSTKAVRLHAWHDVIAPPDAGRDMLAVVREARTAERWSRWTRELEMGATDNKAALQWAAREAAAAADRESRRGRAGRRDERSEGGLLDSWISDHMAARERREMMADRNGEVFFGFERETSSRSWGWLADDVMKREQENHLRDEFIRRNMERDSMGMGHGLPEHPSQLPGRQRFGSEGILGSHPAWR